MIPVGLQLWTLREPIEQDFEGTINKVAEMGYLGVETAFFPEDISLQRAGQLFRDLGLNVLAAHIEVPDDERHKDEMLAVAEAYDCQRMVWHGWPQGDRYHSPEDTRRWAGIYNQAGAFAKEHDLLFGLHNHWWEFEAASGHIPFYYLLDYLDPDIFFEIDTYWAKTAGRDPAQVVADFGERVHLLHIKDGPAPIGEIVNQQVAVGKGTLDVPLIVEAAGTAVEWLVVEFDDCATDIVAAVKESYDYLTQNGLAQGRA
jgi:sugar phosphate isomerase/epimerase